MLPRSAPRGNILHRWSAQDAKIDALPRQQTQTRNVARIFYRIVKTDPPTLDDFKSYRELGIPARTDDPEVLRMREGISVYATETQARNRSRAVPHLGRYVAMLEIPDSAAITHRRTGDSRGHHTIWGDAADVLACVVFVRSV